MPEQSDNGGGAFLWIVDTIGNVVIDRRIRKYNKQSRGLEEYDAITTDTLFPPESYQDNIVISGGDSDVRLSFSERIIQNCVIQEQAVIVLHLSNYGLEDLITDNNWGIVVNKRNKTFDAFTSFKLQEICQVVLDTCKAKYDIKPAGRYILQIVYELLACKKLRPYFSNFASFTYHQIPERINECLKSGLLTQDAANNLNSLLMMGQSECAKIDTFFYDMKAQLSHIATDDANVTRGKSVLSEIRKGKVLCIDLNSSSNIMLIELIINTLTIAMNRGFEFTLFLDDVAIANNETLKNALSQKSRHNNVICSKDMYSLFNGKDDLFTTIAGEADKTVLMSHGSNISCDKWSKYIGEYDKIDVSQNSSGGFSQSDKWGYSTNSGRVIADKRELKIKPEEINRLSQGEIIAYDNQTGSLILANVI